MNSKASVINQIKSTELLTECRAIHKDLVFLLESATKKINLLVTNNHTNTADDKGKKVKCNVAADPSVNRRIFAAAARRRHLSSATNNHTNTADNEGKKVKCNVAADPSVNRRILAAAARRRLLSSATSSHTNTAENKNGLNFKGNGATPCPKCSNAFDPQSERFCGTCEKCDELVCEECFSNCNECGSLRCKDGNCSMEWCEECQSHSCCGMVECWRCSDKICNGCVVLVGPPDWECCEQCRDNYVSGGW